MSDEDEYQYADHDQDEPGGYDSLDWNPFDYIEEDREVLERLALQRKEVPFPPHLLTSDPDKVREIIQRSKAEKVEENHRDYSVPPCEIPARHPLSDDEWPKAAKTLVKKLDFWNWSVWFMRGPVISSQNRVRPIRNCFIVKADHPAGDMRFRSTFHQGDDGKWTRKGDWIYTPEQSCNWSRPGSVKALNEYIALASVERPEPIILED